MTCEYKLLRKHRFCLGTGDPKSDHALLMAAGVSIDKEYVHIEYYACQEFVKFLLDNPRLDHLLVCMTDGSNRPWVELLLSELSLVSDGMDDLTLSYGDTELVHLTATYSYDSRVTTTPEVRRPAN